ncbi:MAG: O-antigen ligase family protein [Cardiobacteriaceae bacterium]|nr:O-antigen ligase family protein [Cardiobacteriaceae bacterium]
MTHFFPRWVNTATFLFFALSLGLKGGYNHGAALLFCFALFSVPWWWRVRRRDPALRHLALAFCAMGLVGIADAWFSGLRLTHYNLPGKFLCMPLLLYFLATFPPKARAVWLGAATGAIFGAITAWYYSTYTPELLTMGRGARYLHPIQLGNIAMLLAMIAACGLIADKNRYARVLLACGVLAGLYTALLSETRGSFFSLLLCLFCLALMHLRRMQWSRRHMAVALALLAAVAVFALSGGEIIAKRLADIRQDLLLYEQGHSATSIGARFELWRFAWAEGLRYPLFGAGTTQMLADKALWFADHPARAFIATLGHLHNEFLDAFARRGSVGLAAVILLFALPLCFYLRRTPRARDQEALACQLAATSHTLLYIGFSLTQAAIYIHSSGFMFLAIPLCVFYSLWLSQLPPHGAES